MRRYLTLLALAFTMSCGSSSKSTSPPPPPAPDNPTPPGLSYSADLQPSSQTFYVGSPNEDVVLVSASLQIWSAPGCSIAGGWYPATDAVGGTVIAKSSIVAVHTTQSLSWDSCTAYYFWVYVHRPNQSKNFWIKLHCDCPHPQCPCA